MLKEVKESGKQVIYVIADKLPVVFPKRNRRSRWADTLPEEMIEDLTDGERFSALGWGCATYLANNPGANISMIDCQFVIDGVTFKNYMPRQIREWYGLSEMTTLKIQSLNLNKAKRSKIQTLIKDM